MSHRADAPGTPARWMRLAATLGALALVGPAAPPAAAQATAVTSRLETGTDRFFTRKDARFRYRDIGHGEPVVLLHGYAQRIELMEDLADSLAGGFRVIVLDERGFGASTKFASPARYGQTMVDDVVALLDYLHIPRAHLVGHSMGAAIAANVAIRYPARVATVSLLAGPFFPDSAAMAARREPWVQALQHGEGITRLIAWLFPGIPDSVAAAESAQALAQNDLGSLIGSMQAMGALTIPPDRRPDRSIRVLIAAGSDDPLLPQSRYLAGRWPEATLLEVSGANHETIRAHGQVIAAVRSLIRGTRQ